MEIKKISHWRTVLKSYRKIIERDKIDTIQKYLTDNFPGLIQALQSATLHDITYILLKFALILMPSF
jgi:ribosomal protein S20